MSEQPDFTLVFLRKLDGKLDRVIEGLTDLKERVTLVEVGQSDLKRDVAHLAGQIAQQSIRLDRFDRRLERLERRLDLEPAP